MRSSRFCANATHCRIWISASTKPPSRRVESKSRTTVFDKTHFGTLGRNSSEGVPIKEAVAVGNAVVARIDRQPRADIGGSDTVRLNVDAV